MTRESATSLGPKREPGTVTVNIVVPTRASSDVVVAVLAMNASEPMPLTAVTWRTCFDLMNAFSSFLNVPAVPSPLTYSMMTTKALPAGPLSSP